MTNSDLSGLLTAIWERLSTLADHVSEGTAETNRRLHAIEMQLLDGHYRMNNIERRQRRQAKAGTTTKLRSFLGQVATFREWAAGATLIILALKGAIAPAEFKAMLMTLLGIAPQ